MLDRRLSSQSIGPDNSLTFALQALLERHETYMAEAEQERRKMTASIGKLEMDKKELEESNAKTIEENRNLLDQLEELNNNVSISDAHIKTVNATLQSTRKEMESLTMLAAQTVKLEAQLLALESEQAGLQDQLVATEEEERSAVQRWKNAERTITYLHEQVDKIEREARDERERHAEVLGRLERRRAMERELERAEGRLKGAAAVTTHGKDNAGSSVVSHFVKDILQDNASLQSGIVELRELLMGSNQEVETLREQMMLHQPVRSDRDDDILKAMLEGEISKSSAIEALPELHVHHHYHAATQETTPRERSLGPRRTRRKRDFLMSGCATSSGSQTPRTPSAHGLRVTPPSSAATILSQTFASIPQGPQAQFAHRWSSQSSQTWSSQAPSSVPSSPQSTAIFDADMSIASSRPTSPESMSPELSPYFLYHRKGNSDVSYRSLSASIPQSNIPQTISSVLQDSAEDTHSNNSPHTPSTSITPSDTNTIHEEPEDYPIISSPLRPHLHRSTSHESILSLSTLDIASPNYSQNLHQSRNVSHSTSRLPFPISTTPLTSATPFLARASFRHHSNHLATYTRLPSRLSSSAATEALAQSATLGRSILGKRVGGWVWGKWGVGAVGEGAVLGEKAGGEGGGGSSSGGGSGSGSSEKEKMKEKVVRPAPRPAGVNQKGSLTHLIKENKEASRVEVGVDEEALREALGEG